MCPIPGHFVAGGPVVGPTDSSWVLGRAYQILTMQTGFALLKAGAVSGKSVANIIDFTS